MTKWSDPLRRGESTVTRATRIWRLGVVLLACLGQASALAAPGEPATSTSPSLNPAPPRSTAPPSAAPPSPAPGSAGPQAAASSPSSSAGEATRSEPSRVLPGAARCFAVDLDGDGHDELLGVQGDRLWAWQLGNEGETGRLLWRTQGPGQAQLMVAGDRGAGRQLFVAWGVGRGYLQAPLTLIAHDPQTGAERARLGEWRGARSQVAHLSLEELDGVPPIDLAFARYQDKYMVQLAPLLAGATEVPARPALVRRMLSGLAWGDLDGDQRLDRFEGRVYGDQRGEYGDLWVRWGHGGLLKVPVDRGVRALLFRDEAEGPALYFADGWVARYGREARAQLSRLRWRAGRPQVERLAEIAGDFTLFSLHEYRDAGRSTIIARGSKAIYRFSESAEGPWGVERLLPLEPGLEVAIGRSPRGLFLAPPKDDGVQLIFPE